MSLQLVDRDWWGARARLGPAMRLPAVGIHVHHSVTKATGDPRRDMRGVERIGVDRFGRFSYSYAIHPGGLVLIGAGTTVGAHTQGYNSSTFGIVFIGNYEIDELPREAVVAFHELRHHLAGTGRLVPNHYVRPHRDRKATACPGRHVMARWGQLIAGRPQPDPEPEPEPEPEEEPGMKDVILQARDRPATWVRGEQLVKLGDGATVTALAEKGGIPVVNISTGDYDHINRALSAREVDVVEPE